jgi:hypothetical protein
VQLAGYPYEVIEPTASDNGHYDSGGAMLRNRGPHLPIEGVIDGNRSVVVECEDRQLHGDLVGIYRTAISPRMFGQPESELKLEKYANVPA